MGFVNQSIMNSFPAFDVVDLSGRRDTRFLSVGTKSKFPSIPAPLMPSGFNLLGPRPICSIQVSRVSLQEDFKAPHHTHTQPNDDYVAAANNNKSRNRITKTRRKYRGSSILSILQALQNSDWDNIEEALKPWKHKISPQEQTIIPIEQPTWEKALALFKWFHMQEDYKPNVIHYNVILRILGRAKKWDELEDCWTQMTKQKDELLPTNNTYGTLIDVYGRAGLKSEALQWIQHMEQQGLQPDEVTMNTVVHMYKKAREFDQAEEFYRKWSQTHRPQRAFTYNTLIDMYGKAGRIGECSNAFSEMLKSGICPDIVTFNTMIHICGSYGHLEEAKVLMNKMEETGCPPNVMTYNTLIAMNAENNNIDMALTYFTRMKQTGVQPNIVTYRTLLRVLCGKHMIREAESLVQEMDELGLRVDDFSRPIIIRMCI